MDPLVQFEAISFFERELVDYRIRPGALKNFFNGYAPSTKIASLTRLGRFSRQYSMTRGGTRSLPVAASVSWSLPVRSNPIASSQHSVSAA